jgi:hypothetical protein
LFGGADVAGILLLFLLSPGGLSNKFEIALDWWLLLCFFWSVVCEGESVWCLRFWAKSHHNDTVLIKNN